MKSLLTLVLVSIGLSAGAAENFKMIGTSDLEKMMKETGTKQVYIFDANTAETRKNDGIIPTAKLLDSSSNYDVAKNLPADKNASLVFYCANTKCMAAPGAAKRAVEAGYKNVAVYHDGIEGWKKAGKTTAKN